MTASKADHTEGWAHWLEERAQLLQQHCSWKQGDSVVLAVSGGPDSMLMMHMFAALRQHVDVAPRQVIVAHVHHGFRGEESDVEAELVRREAQLIGLPCEIARVDAPSYATEQKMNAQAAARELRYTYLRQIAGKYGASYIALAHHADDQAETVLMRMLRGAGTGGLAGMSWRRADDTQSSSVSLEAAPLFHYIRPLLDMRKKDIVDICAQEQIQYAEDSSNEKRTYLRNRLRLDIMPLLEQENPQAVHSICRIADTLRADHDWMEQEANAWYSSYVEKWDVETGVHISSVRNHVSRVEVYRTLYEAGCIVAREDFLKLHVALQRRLIKLILNYLYKVADPIDYDTIERVRLATLRDVPSTWKTDIGQGMECRREYGQLLWLRPFPRMEQLNEEQTITLQRPNEAGCVVIPFHASTLHWRITSRKSSSSTAVGTYDAAFDADALEWPIRIRTRQSGDRMRIQGLNGSKKVQDMFVDAKVPASLREVYPIVTDRNGTVLWVPGIRRSDQALVQVHTDTMLYLSLETNI
ncbi:tRNA lysidine(34) synthetase TilS [Paenibacillus arenosi]|uniref:tRNA(Ile)-lysidine synthase n=1 Tax=Paenibacillus arenosi TaxID=2774142 RepID=A0ABR9B2U8_9BACL|nr:tRNA lysidine(34) synthetase TilS [Paenibacillus arenosi]MBD8500698.1 tRNA lysidine(34) synthetase TilS [Paenibacillus arenosi]